MSNIDAALTPASNGKIPVTKLRQALTTAKAEITALENKVATVQQGATANEPDAQLKDRANHTGTQPIASITGLQTALNSKQASVPTATTQEITDGTETNPRLYSPSQIKAAIQAHGGGSDSGNTIQNITRANVIAALDFTAGNIVNVTDNLPTGTTLLAEPVMPVGVKVGDKFEFYFKKLLATQCTVSFPPDINYQFNNGTTAHLAFVWDGLSLVEA
jgi:hypothetical protein